MHAKLAAYPSSQALAKTVYGFYGDYLQYVEDAKAPASSFEIAVQHEPLEFRFARLNLKSNTNRVAAALTHELLHLNLPITGLPIFEGLDIDGAGEKHGSSFAETCSKTQNLVHHEIQ
jgi:hypothetical protein